jgi:DNA-binding response OmpR family regulator
MVALQTSMFLLSEVAAPSPFSWEYIKDAYWQFFMTHTVAAVCFIAYVLITLFIIMFLVQPKVARIWIRPSSRTGKRGRTAKSSGQNVEDLFCTPVVHAQTKDRISRPERRATAAPLPTRPPVGKTEKMIPRPSPVVPCSAAILYVTDNDSSDRMIDSLGAAGFVVISSQPGKNAVHHITISQFDLIVIDTMVSEAARLCATRIIEALPATPPMPILILANSPGQTIDMAATNARIEYLFKPFDDGFLNAKINLMLAQRNKPLAEHEAGKETPLSYDKHMEKLIESLPATVEDIGKKSVQTSLSNIELHSGVITALGEDASKALQTKLTEGQTPLPEEIQKTSDKVDELLRLCATIKPPKPKN